MSLTKATYSMIEGAPVNILDYGAVGDGTTDNTAAIQAALDVGGSIYVPAGTFVHDSVTMNVANTSLVLDAKAVLKLKASATGSQIVISAANCSVEGGKLDGNRANNTDRRSVNITAAGHGACVQNVFVTSSSGEGLYNTDADRVAFLNNRITDTKYTAIASLASTRSYSDMRVVGNHIDRTGEDDTTGVLGGIQLYGSATYDLVGATVSNNYVKMNRNGVLATPFVCIETRYTDNLIVSDNVTVDGYMGVSLTIGVNTSCTGNTSTNANYAGIELSDMAGKTNVDGNMIDGNGACASGIAVSPGPVSPVEVNSVNITGNTLSNFSSRCIYIIGSTAGKEINISGNMLQLSATTNGIQLVKCEDVNISGNYIGYQTATDKVGLSIETSSKINFTGNTLVNARITIYATTAVTLNDILISGNRIKTVGTALLQSLSGGAALGSNVQVLGNIGNSSAITRDYFDLLNNRFKGFGATGDPNGQVTAGIGSEWTNTVGGAGTTLYIKESGTGNTGWVGK